MIRPDGHLVFRGRHPDDLPGPAQLLDRLLTASAVAGPGCPRAGVGPAHAVGRTRVQRSSNAMLSKKAMPSTTMPPSSRIIQT